MRKIRSYPLLFIIFSLSIIIASDVLCSEEENKESQIKSIEKDLSHEKEQYIQLTRRRRASLTNYPILKKKLMKKRPL